jgi:hypothetical protein
VARSFIGAKRLRKALVFSTLALQPSNEPIIVKLIDPPSDISGLADVLLGAIGITGVIVVGALLFGLVLAGALFWIRSRAM